MVQIRVRSKWLPGPKRGREEGRAIALPHLIMGDLHSSPEKKLLISPRPALSLLSAPELPRLWRPLGFPVVLSALLAATTKGAPFLWPLGWGTAGRGSGLGVGPGGA